MKVCRLMCRLMRRDSLYNNPEGNLFIFIEPGDRRFYFIAKSSDAGIWYVKT